MASTATSRWADSDTVGADTSTYASSGRSLSISLVAKAVQGNGPFKPTLTVDDRRFVRPALNKLLASRRDRSATGNHQSRRCHGALDRHAGQKWHADQESLGRGVGPALQLAAVDGVIAAPDDEPGESDGDHGGSQDREAARHLGHHQHHRERCSGDAAEAAHHADNDVGRRAMAHRGNDGSNKRQTTAPINAPMTIPVRRCRPIRPSR